MREAPVMTGDNGLYLMITGVGSRSDGGKENCDCSHVGKVI